MDEVVQMVLRVRRRSSGGGLLVQRGRGSEENFRNFDRIFQCEAFLVRTALILNEVLSTRISYIGERLHIVFCIYSFMYLCIVASVVE